MLGVGAVGGSRLTAWHSLMLTVVPPVPQEVQIHGEVNLKKHVQRLVAASKYRDVPKTQRLVQLHRNTVLDGHILHNFAS